MMWLPSSIRMWTCLDFRMKGLTGLLLQNKHCHSAPFFSPFHVFYLTLLAAFRENWGLRADSNQLAVYSVWVQYSYTSSRHGWSDKKREWIVVTPEDQRLPQCIYLIMQSLMSSSRLSWITTFSKLKFSKLETQACNYIGMQWLI